MDKQSALKELQALKARADALEAIINAPEVPQVFQGVYLRENQTHVPQFYVSISCNVSRCTGVSTNDAKYGIAFHTSADCKKYLSYLELVQKARVAMAKAWAGKPKPVWRDRAVTKYCLQFYNNKLVIDGFCKTYAQFHFPSHETAAAFIETLSPEEGILLMKGMDA